jgi:metal-responsive CopG/Arc/MetJ family transcriptional regulator
MERLNRMPFDKIGVTKKVSITLQEENWEWIDDYIKRGEVTSRSEFFRWLFEGKIKPYNERMFK